MSAPKSDDVVATALSFLLRTGYDAASVGDLATATGMSRSTFFRRFGSKDDVVFADHDLLLTRIEALLRDSHGDPLASVAAAARLVLQEHVGRPEMARTRYALLRQQPALRDRELVTSHRYERAFTTYLRETTPHPVEREWVLVAYASSVVALHNRVLRAWLRDALDEPVDAFDLAAAELAGAFRPMLQPDSARAPRPPRVVVAVVEEGAEPADVLRAIATGLEAAPEASATPDSRSHR